MHRAASLAAITATVFFTACASGRIRKENERALAIADTKVLEGCYGCLGEARATYERLASARKPLPGVSTRLFETNVLIALRERELGLDAGGALEKARALSPRLPAAMEPARVLAMANAMMPDGNALPLHGDEVLGRQNAEFVKKINDELVWVEQAPLTPAVRRYIALALDCTYADRKNKAIDSLQSLAKRREVPINAPPLLAYRAAYCAKTDTFALKRVLVAAPAMAEAAYALAQTLIWRAAETGGEDVYKLFEQSRARFPRAAGIPFLTGWLDSNVGDCESAVRRFDETLVIEPRHDRAMLQKAICLTNLKRDTLAIAAATRFIDLHPPNIAQGYYWRAVSQLRLRALDLARADIESAKATSKGGDVLSLAGMIEFEQADYGVAETDLKAARATWQGWKLCGAGFYLGSTLTKREAWPDAAAQYDSAMVCYQERAGETEAKLADVRESARGSAAYRARRIASLENDLADRRRRYRTSAFNFASMQARQGQLARVDELLAVAAEEPDLTDQVVKLKEQVAALVQYQQAQSRPAPGRRP
ncbi:MAG TPA: tetratricopeptide repeat protein [Gemmatimonadaceae bacterium]|nr:tetratricopeptide repeat protein [Gemmatimonadaceae bacterium]